MLVVLAADIDDAILLNLCPLGHFLGRPILNTFHVLVVF